MTIHQTVELRRWWRETSLDGYATKEIIRGYVYNDPNDVWDDGEYGEFEDVSLYDHGGFYTFEFGRVTFKLYKDEEKK